ncbi:MAG: bifunctional folylpolyglutamate synthase/dihydrofolate synthase [Candidatus Humimicrobiaceae bacterium]
MVGINLNYSEACKYLDNTLVFGIKPNLLRINKILELLGNPHKKVEFIHIAGTNGKTSTTKITAAILNSHNYKAGYYISPHVHSYTERISIKGHDISSNDFAAVLQEILPLVEKVNEFNLDGEMTQFEILTAMMFYAAIIEKLDVMVLEAGMGGRWDATNAAYAGTAGLTGVSLEHTQILGKTIAAITKEKAEIIKSRCRVATSSTDLTVLKILEEKCAKTGSELFEIGKAFEVKSVKKDSIEGFTADIKGIYDVYKKIMFPIPGDYQKANVCLAVALSELFTYDKLDTQKINRGLACTNISGRFQVMRTSPIFIADASHNPEGIKNLAFNIMKYFRKNKKIIIFSVLKDKEYEEMIKAVLPVADIMILTSSYSARSLEVNLLEEAVIKESQNLNTIGMKSPKSIYRIDTIANSIKFSLDIALKNDIICLTGSITNLEFVKSEYF